MKGYPIKFQPIYKDYLWGGNRIIQKYHRAMPQGRYAESWEIADRDNGMSVVLNGIYKNMTLSQLLFEWQEDLLGINQKFLKFPLLIKILDATQPLSIQVHPNNEKSNKLNAEPKNEAWFALDDSTVFAGFKAGVDKRLLKLAIEEKKVTNILRRLNLLPGDVVHIPGGRVHGICAGSLLYEVQQNSDTTYRIYDYDRTDEFGNVRSLHLIQALEAIEFQDIEKPKIDPIILMENGDYTHLSLLITPYFVLEKLIIKTGFKQMLDHSSFIILFSLNGNGVLASDGYEEPLIAGTSYLIPACASKVEVNANNVCEVLKTTLC